MVDFATHIHIYASASDIHIYFYSLCFSLTIALLFASIATYLHNNLSCIHKARRGQPEGRRVVAFKVRGKKDIADMFFTFLLVLSDRSGIFLFKHESQALPHTHTRTHTRVDFRAVTAPFPAPLCSPAVCSLRLFTLVTIILSPFYCELDFVVTPCFLPELPCGALRCAANKIQAKAFKWKIRFIVRFPGASLLVLWALGSCLLRQDV